MAGGRMYNNSSCSGGDGGGDASSLSVLIQRQKGVCSSHQPLDSPFLSGSSPSPYLGSRSMVSFEDVRIANGSNTPCFCPFDRDENGDDFDEYFHQPEKKRRLAVDQVQFLEKSFEVENKLEPERKIQLAKDLGLQPRQVAIWFQNRRARWKTKQLEKDFEVLQASYSNLKSDYDNLLKEKDKLKSEVLLLTDRLHPKEKEGGNTKSSGVNSTTLCSQEPPQKPIADSASEGEVSKVSIVACKQEDISSTRSDMFDSDSPHYTDGVHSSLLEAGDSSYVFEHDQSDLSQDEDDNLCKNFLPPYIFPKLEEADDSDPPTSSCNFGFSIEDHAIWSWLY